VLEIIEKCREGEYSEVESVKFGENVFNVECSEVQ